MKNETKYIAIILRLGIWAFMLVYGIMIIFMGVSLFMEDLSWDQVLLTVGIMVLIGYMLQSFFEGIREDIRRAERRETEGNDDESV